MLKRKWNKKIRLKCPVRTYYKVYSSLSPEYFGDYKPRMNIWKTSYPIMVPFRRANNSFLSWEWHHYMNQSVLLVFAHLQLSFWIFDWALVHKKYIRGVMSVLEIPLSGKTNEQYFWFYRITCIYDRATKSQIEKLHGKVFVPIFHMGVL